MEDKNPLEQIEQPFDRKIAGNFQLRTRVAQNRSISPNKILSAHLPPFANSRLRPRHRATTKQA